MVEYKDENHLSEMLKAMSDSTRRSLLTRICQYGPSRVTDLAEAYEMSLNAVSKHIKVLERAGLVQRRMKGRTHWIAADLQQLETVEHWMQSLKSIWALRLNKLDEILTEGETDNE